MSEIVKIPERSSYGHVICQIILFFLIFGTLACSGKTPLHKPTYRETGAATVAVMPVNNTSGNERAANLIRHKTSEEIFFKGYRRIPLAVIDEALARGNHSATGGKSLPVPRLPLNPGIDALLYITLTEATLQDGLLGMTMEVAASFELIATTSGQLLWQSRHVERERAISLTKTGRERRAHMSFEDLLQRVVEKGLSSFPEGPILAPAKDKKNK